MIETIAMRGVNSGVLHPGERWRFSVRLKRPHGNANPHGFDYEAWLLERNIRATGTILIKGERQRLDSLVLRPGYLSSVYASELVLAFFRYYPMRPF